MSFQKMPGIDHSLMGVGGEWLLWHASALTTNCLIVSIAILVIVSANEESSNQRWEFKCPNVGDVSKYRRVVVTWTLNNEIWLKIDHGNLSVVKQLTMFTKNKDSPPNSPKIYTVTANDGRYKFFYNELEGDFFMHVQNGKTQDNGLWQCIVTLYNVDGKVEEIADNDMFEVVGVTSWPDWRIVASSGVEDEPDKDIFSGDDMSPIIVDDGFSFNNTATRTFRCFNNNRYFYYSLFVVPIFITFPAVIIF